MANQVQGVPLSGSGHSAEPEPVPVSADTASVPNAEVYRLIEVDFESRSITLRALGVRHVSFASGNYVVLPQAEFICLQNAAERVSS